MRRLDLVGTGPCVALTWPFGCSQLITKVLH